METLAASPTVSDVSLSSLLDTAGDGIIVIDKCARLLVFNRACERLLGYRASDVLGTNVTRIIPPENDGGDDRYLWNTAVRKAVSVNGRHRSGRLIPLELSLGEAMTPDGRQLIAILHDLRPCRETERRLNRLQVDLVRITRASEIEEIGATLAHELNQPLTAVMLYLQAFKRTSVLRPSAAEILEKALHEAERAGNIIQRMRRLVEKRDPLRRLMDLTALIDEAVELTLLGHHPGTRITRDFTDDLPPVLIDPVQIQQIVVNLVRNALEAVKEHTAPDVRICTRRSRDMVELKVEDNGPGIPDKTLPHLFKAFSSSKRGGLGLGLVISRAIAQSHGGDLTVAPGGNGEGASFTLQLPLPPPVAAPLPAAC